MRKRLKSLDGKNTLTVVLVMASLAIVAGGFIAQAVQYNELFGLYEKQNSQLKANGIKPLTPSPSQIAERGPVGDPGLTGDTGARGPSPTPAQIADAVRDYCAIQFGCVGAPGAVGPVSTVPGPTGTAGADSTVPGPSGTNGTNGAAGSDSTVPGPAGRGIVSVTCQDDSSWLVTYTDGTTQMTNGPCRVSKQSETPPPATSP